MEISSTTELPGSGVSHRCRPVLYSRCDPQWRPPSHRAKVIARPGQHTTDGVSDLPCRPWRVVPTVPYMQNARWLLLVLSALCSACASHGGADGYVPPKDMASALPPPQADPCDGIPTRGRCLDAKTLQSCLVDARGRAIISKINCNSSELCVTEADESFCKLMAPCRDGQSRCTPTGSERCIAGRWSFTPCGAGESCQRFPGVGVQCVPLGVSVRVVGQLQYQVRFPRSDLSGFETSYALANARQVFVVVVEAGAILGTGSADGTGRFSVSCYRTPGPTAQLLFIPLLYNDTDTLTFAVAQPSGSGDGDFRRSPALWSYSLSSLPSPRAGTIDVGSWQIPGESAGAMRIFDWMLYGFELAPGLFGAAPQRSLVALWSPTHVATCGACYMNRSQGGTDVGTGPYHFDTTIELSGTPASPTHWATSVINHEFGHYLMDQFSKSPNEGGPHSVAQVSKPGLAWSEGFATFSGQATLTRAAGSPAPIYFDVQNSTAFWVDISLGAYNRGSLPRPDPSGRLDQFLNENIVAGMIWDLWQTFGDTPVFRGMRTSRLLGPLNRGYGSVDLVDYADGLACDGLISASALTNVLRRSHQFPWDGLPLCR